MFSLILGIITKLRSLLRLVIATGAALVALTPWEADAVDAYLYTPLSQTFHFEPVGVKATLTNGTGFAGAGTYRATLRVDMNGTPLNVNNLDFVVNASGQVTNITGPWNLWGPTDTRWINGTVTFRVDPTAYRVGFGNTVPVTMDGDKIINVLQKEQPGRTGPGETKWANVAITLGTPPPKRRTAAVSVVVKNWNAFPVELHAAARADNGQASLQKIGEAPAATTAKQMVNGVEKTVTTPGIGGAEATFQEPTPDAWMPAVITHGAIMSVLPGPGAGGYIAENEAVKGPVSDTKYGDSEFLFEVGTPPPPLPDDIIEKPEAPEPPPAETPGSPTTPKPGTAPPTDPKGTPTPKPTAPTVPTMDPNIEPWTRPMTGTGGSGPGGTASPHDFYNGIRAALGDDAAAGDGAGEGNGNGGIGGVGGGNDLSDLTGSLENRGDLDKVQGKMNESIARVQNAKATLATKITPLTKTDWMQPPGLTKNLKLDMGTATLAGGKTLNIAVDLNKFSGPVAAIRLGLCFCLAIAYTVWTLNTVRDGIA